ncbi:MAG: T9SS type A sorting domain-containing protein [Bacteroidota bacterium]
MRFFSTKAKSIRHFRALSKKLGKMVEDGSFFQLAATKQQELRKRLASLYREIRAVFSAARLKRILASSAMLIGLAVGAQAQFAAPVPFNNGLKQDDVPVFHFADIDGDGDQDAFMSAYGDSTRVFLYQENIGTAQAASFDTVVQNPLGVTINFTPTTIDLADIDNDGDFDLFIGSYDFDTGSAPIFGWQNMGSATSFSTLSNPAQNPFSLMPAPEVSEIAFADLDGDGDPDALMNDYNDTLDFDQFRYQENLGNNPFPNLAAPQINPFGLSNSRVETFVMDIADLDMDGDNDLMIAGYEDNGMELAAFHYYENTGSATMPAFAAAVTNPFNLQAPFETALILPDLVDIDGDGDPDIIATVYNDDTEESSVYFYENLGISTSTNELEAVSQFMAFPTTVETSINWIIDVKEPMRNSQLQVVDMLGRVLDTDILDLTDGRNTGVVSVTALTKGMYILNLTDDQGNPLANQRFFVK